MEHKRSEDEKVALTEEQAASEVARASRIYPIVRLLDENAVETDANCLLLGDRCPCLRQVCKDMLREGEGEVCEQLSVGDKLHRGTVRYVEVDGVPHVLLKARPLEQAGEVDRELLYTDALTEIKNRRYYEDKLRTMRVMAGVAVVDLDDFKMLNDTFGHHVGDLALKTAAQAMQKSIRSTDTLVRYGGDEFVIVMPNISSTDFAVRLRDVSDAVTSSTVPGHENLRLSASVGGALASNQTVENAVRRADKLMYHAKVKRGAVVTDSDAQLDDDDTVKPLLLIVDDAEMNRAILKEMLKSDYEIIEADSGRAALDAIDRYGNDLALVLLDIIMPGMSGFEVLAEMSRESLIDDVPVIMISSEDADDVVLRAYEMGASDYVSRPFDARVVRRRVSNIIRLYAKQRRLGTLLAQQYYERVKNSQMLIDIMAGVMELRNGESGLHVTHIEKLTELLLERLVQVSDEFDIDNEQRGMIAMASALHDIGKMSIDDAILNKPGRLTPEEFEIMKTHTTIGSDMLDELGRHHAHNALLSYAYQIARWHHERWDGKGYPDGLKGDNIPIAAQVVSVADVYDALTSVRVYKKAIPHEKAIQMILDGECGQFNPLLIQCLLDVQDRIAETLENPADVVLFPTV